jgi:hypothetical protein
MNQATLFSETEMPFGLFSESTGDGEREQAERDDARERAAAFERAQERMFTDV